VKSIVLAMFAAGFALSAASADEYGVATSYHNPWRGGLIAAHLTPPFGARAQVLNLDNSRSAVMIRVDRGPLRPSASLTSPAVGQLGALQAGVAHVRFEWSSPAWNRIEQEARA
jgi:rare lipoprotein A (peptidoglycan hydrolase)